MSGPRVVTLLTDFGTSDGYVAAMKGVLAREASRARVVDAGHDVPRGDPRAGAWALEAYWSVFPEGTVHLVVVDPGVGTARRAVAVESGGRFLVGPDNGVLGPALRTEGWRGVALPWDAARAPVSGHTFHGRDLFAPAAARLAAGAPLETLGDPLADPVLLDEPEPRTEESGVLGEVVHVDRFGNLITNLDATALEGARSVEVRTGAREVEGAFRRVPVGSAYGEVESGALLALVNSFGRVEVARRDGSAAEAIGAGRGVRVRVPVPTRRPRASDDPPP